MTCEEAFRKLLKTCLIFGGGLKGCNWRVIKGAGLPCPFLKIEKKCPDYVLPWVKFSIQNVVLSYAGTFFAFVFDKMFIKVLKFHETYPPIKYF